MERSRTIPASAHAATAVDALTGVFVTAFNARNVGHLLTALAEDVRLISEAAEAPLEGRSPVGMHFRRHLEELREADPVNVVAARGSVAFAGVDDYPCAIVFDGRQPASLICLEAAAASAESAEPAGTIQRIHVVRDPVRVHAARPAETPPFREPPDRPEVVG